MKVVRYAAAAACLLITATSGILDAQESKNAGAMQITKPSDREIVLTRPFAAPRQKVFQALTGQDQIPRWFQPSRMSLASYEVDFKPGGAARYVFQRPNGRRMEMRHLYKEANPPKRWDYTESYDFSPLVVEVTTILEERDGKTILTQTMLYPSRQERDADFDAWASSAAEIYDKLDRYLESSQ